MKAYAFTATFWVCPECKSRPYYRDVARTFDGEVVYVGPELLQCPECGRCLSEQEARPVKNGGLLRGCWWFTCRACYHDSFADETVYGKDALGLTTERPPSRASCTACDQEHELSLPD